MREAGTTNAIIDSPPAARERRASTPAENFVRSITGPVVIPAVCVIAGVLTQMSSHIGIIVLSWSILFIMIVLSVTAQRMYASLRSHLEHEEEVARLTGQQSPDLVGTIHAARDRVMATLSGPGSPGSILNQERHAFAAILGTASDRSLTMSEVALDMVCDQYVSGSKPGLDTVDGAIEGHVEKQLANLDTLANVALPLGFFGTLAGLGWQAFNSQSISTELSLSHDFLGGSLLATSTTLVGLLVFGYARWLRAFLYGEFEDISALLRRTLAHNVLPACDARTRAVIDVGGVLQSIVDRFRNTVDKLAKDLTAAIPAGYKEVSDAIRKQLKEEVAPAITKAIAVPVAESIGTLNNTLETQQSATRRAIRELKGEVESCTDALEEETAHRGDLAAAAASLQGVVRSTSTKFLEVTRQANAAAGALESAAAEVRVTLEELYRLQPVSAKQTESLERLIKENETIAHNLQQAMRSVTALISRLVEEAPLTVPEEGL